MSHNIMKEYIELNQKEIRAYIRLIFSNKFNNEISSKFEETYINVRYYNYYDDNEELTFRKRLLQKLKDTQEDLIQEIPKEKILIQNMGVFYAYILHFDTISYCKDINITIQKLNKLRIRLLNKNSKKFIQDFLEINSGCKLKKQEFLKKFETSDFYLRIANYPNHTNIYKVDLKHNLRFPMIYSELAIEKAFTTGITNEDKLVVEYYLLSLVVIKDIAKGNFIKHYIVEFADTLLKKQTKIKGILNIINNEAIQGKVRLKITYQQFINNKEEIYELTKEGFKFAIILDDTFIVEYAELHRLNIFDYVIISKKLKIYDEIMQNKVILNSLIEI